MHTFKIAMTNYLVTVVGQLQDDFLPRVSTESVKRVFLTTFALYVPKPLNVFSCFFARV